MPRIRRTVFAGTLAASFAASFAALMGLSTPALVQPTMPENPPAEPRQTEREPNDEADAATPMPLNVWMDGTRNRDTDAADVFRVSMPAESAGLWRLEFVKTRGLHRTDESVFHIGLRFESATHEYDYAVDLPAREFHFYPVIPAGNCEIWVEMHSGIPRGTGYALRLSPADATPTDADFAAARAAISRAETWLQQSPFEDDGYFVAMRALTAMALLQPQTPAETLAFIEREFLAPVEAAFEPIDEAAWQGKPVESPTTGAIYGHAIATMALAELAAHGDANAKALCARGVEFLLAAQRSEHRGEQWGGPVRRDGGSYGGWRYYGMTEDDDISVTGWCIVALLAADTAGVRVPGTVAAVERAIGFVKACGKDDGFVYSPESADPGDVRDAIGALSLLIFDEDSKALPIALQALDRHFPAGTQTDRGEAYPFYYWYYATRANFVRAGIEWQRWCALQIRQLLRWQRADGSWMAIRHVPNERYATAMAVLILRLCVGDAPPYLRREIRGF